MFRGVELVKRALDECYGVDQVSLVSATFRWINHHSKISPDHNGECTQLKAALNSPLSSRCYHHWSEQQGAPGV